MTTLDPAVDPARTSACLRRSLVRYAVWALVGCVPFWLAGLIFGRIPWLPTLPWAAVGAIVPATVAVVLARREGTLGWLRAKLRPHTPVGWWLVATVVGVAPTLLDGLRHGPWTPPGPGVLAALLALYVVAAFGEELGWTGFALPRLLRLTGSVWLTALSLGGYWALWHFVPYLLTGRPLDWVLWQTLQVVLSRCVLVGVCVASRGGVWVAVWMHALGNLAWTALPNAGAGYDPLVVDAILVPLAVMALALGGRVCRRG